METRIVTAELGGRDNYADFLKYLLIWMVILGHFINFYQRTSGPAGALYNWIYTFHMPLFVFLSGYFSKHIDGLRRKNIETLIYPFFLFQIINILYAAIIPLEPLNNNIFYPYHQNWYLLALFWWRTFIPYCRFYNKYIVLIFALILCLSAGFFPEWNGFLGLYKTVYFLPFFLLGFYCSNLSLLISNLWKRRHLWLSFFFLSIFAMLVVSFDSSLLQKVNYAFKADAGYNGEWINVFYRFGAIFISIVMCLSVLVASKLIYNSLKFKRFIGGGTMVAFLCHEFIMIPIIRVYARWGSWGFLLCIATSLFVAYFLTRRKVVSLFTPLLDLSVPYNNLKKLKIIKK